jgi:uncharacterized SAM-dependent methyltransferase
MCQLTQCSWRCAQFNLLRERRAIHKTKSILSVFKLQRRAIHYFALDVSRRGLTASVMELNRAMKDAPFVSVTGLLGTYEDCIHWISHSQGLRKFTSANFLWMGNSIANFGCRSTAADFLSRFRSACQQSLLGCRFIVSIDICQNEDKVFEAYSMGKPELRAFLLNGFLSANAALGKAAFNLEDWSLSTSMDAKERSLHLFAVARRDLQVRLEKDTSYIAMRKGDRLQLATSGKWSEEMVRCLCAVAKLQILQCWKDKSGDFCECLLIELAAEGVTDCDRHFSFNLATLSAIRTPAWFFSDFN